MDEEQQKQEEESPTDNSGEGNQQQSPTLVEGANAAAERLEKATELYKAENDRREELMARDMLGGKTEAGQEPAPPKEESPKDYMKNVMSGGLTSRLDKTIAAKGTLVNSQSKI